MRGLVQGIFFGWVLTASFSFSRVWAEETKKVKTEPTLNGSSFKPPPSVTQVQKELENILQIYKTVRAQNLKEIQEIQKVSEDAKAQQKILANLKMPPQTSRVQPEKIYSVQEKVSENKVVVEKIPKESHASVADAKPSSEKKSKKFFRQ